MCFPARIHVRVSTSSWEKLFRESEPEKLLAAHEVILACSTSPSGEPRGLFAELESLVENGHTEQDGEQHAQKGVL